MTTASATDLLVAAIRGIATYETADDSRSAKGILIEKISALGEPLQMAEAIALQKGYSSLEEALNALPPK